MNDTVLVGIANEGEQQFKVELVQKWEPKNITYIGDTVFFKHDDSYFSMRATDFRTIFSK